MQPARWSVVLAHMELVKAVLTVDPARVGAVALRSGLSRGRAGVALWHLNKLGFIGVKLMGSGSQVDRRFMGYFLYRAARGESLDSWLCGCWWRNPLCCVVCQRCELQPGTKFRR